MIATREKEPKKRGPKQYSCNHLRNDLRLPDPFRNDADQPANQKDDGDLTEELYRQMHVVQFLIPLQPKIRQRPPPRSGQNTCLNNQCPDGQFVFWGVFPSEQTKFVPGHYSG